VQQEYKALLEILEFKEQQEIKVYKVQLVFREQQVI
jgi:hypothetical protein